MASSSDNQGPALERGIWTAMAIAIIIVILRVIAKIKTHTLGIDDGLMVFSTVNIL